MKNHPIFEKKQVAGAFSNAALSYDHYAFAQRHIGSILCEQVQSEFSCAHTTLDLGSGTGKFTSQLYQAVNPTQLIGLDIASTMCRVAQRQTSNANFICADIEQLPIIDNSIDLIVSNCSLQWCPDPQLVFQECLRVLKPGGQFFFTTLGPATLTELRQAWAQVDDHDHVHPFIDMHNLGDILHKTGFAFPTMQREDLIFTYTSVQQLLADLRNIGAQNRLTHRRKTLTAPIKLRKMFNAYEEFKQEQLYPATYEVISGYGVKPKA